MNISSEDQVRKAVEAIYKQYDLKNTGFLGGVQLVNIVKNKKDVNNDDVKRIMQVIDTNNDGKISKDQLYVILKRCTHQ